MSFIIKSSLDQLLVKFDDYRDDLFATAGATQGLDLLSHTLFSEGDLVFVEDPTYHLAMKVFGDSGMKIIGGE